uniref:Cyclin-dependent kinase G-2 n=1 Tax=Rhizophora mucronata TaxID=61149 RepID=A0A2P2M8W1_RHIMU
MRSNITLLNLQYHSTKLENLHAIAYLPFQGHMSEVCSTNQTQNQRGPVTQ